LVRRVRGGVNPKQKGRDLLTPQNRHGNALTGTFSGTPDGACLVLCPVSEISRFVLDSSRSRKSVVGFVVTYVVFPNEEIESKPGA